MDALCFPELCVPSGKRFQTIPLHALLRRARSVPALRCSVAALHLLCTYCIYTFVVAFVLNQRFASRVKPHRRLKFLLLVVTLEIRGV